MPGALAQELRIGFTGQDQAGNGVVEQGADGENGLGAGAGLLQPVVGDHDVRPAAELPDLSDGLFGADGGNRLIAPLRQDRFQAFQHQGVIVDHHDQPALAILVRARVPGDRQPCRLRHGERQFDAEGGALARP